MNAIPRVIMWTQSQSKRIIPNSSTNCAQA